MDTALKFLKDNVKATVTLVVLGFTLTIGWAKGCTVSTDVPKVPVPVELPAGQP